MSRANLLSLFDEFARFSSGVAIVQQRGYRREAWTYQKLAGAAVLRALQLKEHGVQTGDCVLLWGPNSAEWVAAFWGCLLRGAVVVPLDDSSTLDFASRVAADAGIKFAFASRSKPHFTLAVPTVFLEDFPGTPEELHESAGHGNAKPGLHAAVSVLSDQPITRSHVAQILFTSGTTGEPRGIVLTHGNFLANLEPVEKGVAEYRKYERWFHPLSFVSVVPLSHVFGQFMTLFVPPLLGATVVFENSPQPSEILRAIKRERATALIAVPRMLDALRTAFDWEIDAHGWRAWFSSAYAAASQQPFLRRVWRFRRLHRRLGWKFWAFISGGAALSPETEEFFKRIGYAVVQGYGMTETASLISLNHPFRAAQGSVGKILPGREFRLAEDGEILVRGENVSPGYWENGALRQETAERGGWLHTGDLGELDAQGNLRFRGRKKNVIVTPAGLNIHPEDLEAALQHQPGIRDAVVIPLQTGDNAEPCAILLLAAAAGESSPAPSIVIPSEAPALLAGAESRDHGNTEPLLPSMESSSADSSIFIARAAIDAANSTLADYQRIRHWLVWPDLDFPRTPTGKPRLSLLASRAAELLGASTNTVIQSEAKDLLSSTSFTSSTSLPSSTSLASPPASLKELSSLDRVELLSSLEHRYNIELNETQFANATSFADIQKLIAQPSARRSDHVYSRWTQRAPVRLFRLFIYYALTWPATLLLAHPRIRGREHLANLKGPVLFVANHTTRRADIGLILYSIPVRFRHRLATAMGGEMLREFRHPPREWFFAKRWLWQLSYFLVISLFNVFPLPQLSGFRESFRFAGESADRGYSLLVFPEGIVNDRDTPDMVPFQPGIGLLAQNLRIPIVPIRLDGVWQMKQQHRRLAHFGELTIHLGAPVAFPPDTPPAEITSQLQSLLRAL
jgi:long-chain acyl-CoA synthetase